MSLNLNECNPLKNYLVDYLIVIVTVSWRMFWQQSSTVSPMLSVFPFFFLSFSFSLSPLSRFLFRLIISYPFPLLYLYLLPLSHLSLFCLILPFSSFLSLFFLFLPSFYLSFLSSLFPFSFTIFPSPLLFSPFLSFPVSFH